MSEEQRPEDYPTREDFEVFTRMIEDALNDPATPVGYCSWPDCPICKDRGLLPEQGKEIDDREEHAG